MNIPIKWGGLIGGTIVIVTLAVYLASEGSLESPMLSVTTMLLYIFGMSKAALETRNDYGGFISWSEALKPAWITAIVAVVITTIFTYILYNIIDPGLTERMKEVAMETVEKMSGFMSEEMMEQMMEEMENKEFKFGLMEVATTILFSGGVFGFIGAAIIALIVKKEGQGMEDDDLSVI